MTLFILKLIGIFGVVSFVLLLLAPLIGYSYYTLFTIPAVVLSIAMSAGKSAYDEYKAEKQSL